jgi:hypothetical protein
MMQRGMAASRPTGTKDPSLHRSQIFRPASNASPARIATRSVAGWHRQPQSAEAEAPMIRWSRAYIEDHLADPMTIDDVARDAEVTRLLEHEQEQEHDLLNLERLVFGLEKPSHGQLSLITRRWHSERQCTTLKTDNRLKRPARMRGQVADATFPQRLSNPVPQL